MLSANLHTAAKNAAGKLKFVTLAALLLAIGVSGCTKCSKSVDENDTTLNVYLRVNLKGIDPIRADDLYSSTVVQNVFEGLLQYHYLKRPLELEPAIADGMPVASNNGLTHTFKIKKGIKFHDNPAFPDGKGRELVAQDFVYSFKRLADPKNASQGFWIFDGYVKGLNEWAADLKSGKATYDTPVAGLETPDSHTLVIHLTKPYYQLYYVLAMGFATAVPKEAIEKYGEEFLNNPVGTGPFMLENASDWVRNSKVTLKRNPNYREELYPSDGEAGDKEKGLFEDAGKKIPFAQTLIFNEMVEDQPRWQNFMKGNLEFVEIPNDNFETAVTKEDRNKIQPDLASKGITLDITPNLDITYIGFNMKDPVVGKNKALRQALTLSQDTGTLIDKFYNGRGIIAQGPVPPGISSYDPNYKNPYQVYDLEKAKAKMKEAGFEGKNLELTYEALSDSKARQQAEFYAQNWAKIGVKVRINANTWPQFQEKIKAGKAQIFGIAWGADYPDAQNFLQLFYSKNHAPGPNDSSYTNLEFDKLYEQSLTLPPSPERDVLYQKMRDIVVEDAPWMFNLHRQAYYLRHAWLKNFKFNDITRHQMYKYIRVDTKQRAETVGKL